MVDGSQPADMRFLCAARKGLVACRVWGGGQWQCRLTCYVVSSSVQSAGLLVALEMQSPRIAGTVNAVTCICVARGTSCSHVRH